MKFNISSAVQPSNCLHSYSKLDGLDGLSGKIFDTADLEEFRGVGC